MANETKLTFGLAVTGGVSLGTVTANDSWTITQGHDDRSHSIGTSEESITFTDITTNGWVQLYNADSTNYVDWGFSTGVYGGRLEAGMRAMFYLKPAATLYLLANTAACRVRITHVGG